LKKKWIAPLKACLSDNARLKGLRCQIAAVFEGVAVFAVAYGWLNFNFNAEYMCAEVRLI
jgi:hypothetical protein